MNKILISTILCLQIFVISCGGEDRIDTGWVSDEYVVDCNDIECSIPSGEFMMGCDSELFGLCNGGNSPYHLVRLSAYKIDKYEVTSGDYQKCIDAGDCSNNNAIEPHYSGYKKDSEENSYCNLGAEGKSNHPMNCVSWFGAIAYCNWLNRRLPTEAEWEKAARGTDGRMYPWGNKEPNCDYAIMALYNEETDRYDYGCGINSTWAIGSKDKGMSPYGVYDMAGNVFEWVNDWYDEDYYEITPSENPTGPETGRYRVAHGGSWDFDYKYGLRIFNRGYNDPDVLYNYNGFRCASDE